MAAIAQIADSQTAALETNTDPLQPFRHRQIASAYIITMNKQRWCCVIE